MLSLLDTQEFLLSGLETKMEFRFGVRVGDIEKAVEWVEVAIGLKSQARESSDLGGDYYAFGGPGGEKVRLFNNRDVYDNEPVIDGCDEWPIVLFLEGAERHSAVFEKLLEDSAHFVFVSSR